MMKKRRLLILLTIICIGLFIPKNVFAHSSYQYVDYRFVIEDESGNSVEGLDFQLYDESGLFNFISKYDEENKYYYFDVFTDNQDITSAFPSGLADFNIPRTGVNEDRCTTYTGIINSIIDSDPKFSISKDFCFFVMNGLRYYPRFNYSANSVIPMILEEKNSNIKRIVFGQMHYNYYYDFSDSMFKFFIVNNDSFANNCNNYNAYYGRWEDDQKCDFYYNGRSRWPDDNIRFMRDAVYDYSDELWEEFNSGPIASSEMSFENSSVVRDNVGSSSLDGPSIIRFNKISNDDNASDSKNIISNIVNPKTFNNGIVILIISLLLVVGILFVIIKKRNVKI